MENRMRGGAGVGHKIGRERKPFDVEGVVIEFLVGMRVCKLGGLGKRGFFKLRRQGEKDAMSGGMKDRSPRRRKRKARGKLSA